MKVEENMRGRDGGTVGARNGMCARLATADSPATAQGATTNGNFSNYTNRSTFALFNRTALGTTSQLLNGGVNGQVGLAKTYRIYAGDKVKIEAYGKYTNATSTGSNLSGFASALLAAYSLPVPAGGETGTPSAALNTWGGLVAGGSGGTGTVKAFVNIIVFDKNYRLLDMMWDPIDANANQVGATPIIAHDYMMREYTAKEESIVYMYVSNESPTLVDVYFDDVTMTYTPGNIVQYNEYYPYGLQTATSWTRENNTSNNFLYNGGTELNTTTQVYDLHYRNYDPVLGRMNQVDPMASAYASATPYNYAFNSPTVMNDPLGDDPKDPKNTPKPTGAGGNANGGCSWCSPQDTGSSGYSGGRNPIVNPGFIRPEVWDKLGPLLNKMWNNTDKHDGRSVWDRTTVEYYVGNRLAATSRTEAVWGTDAPNYGSRKPRYLNRGLGMAMLKGFILHPMVFVGAQQQQAQGSTDQTLEKGPEGMPLISNTASNATGGLTAIWGGTFSWGVEEAARGGNFTRNAVRAAKVGGTALGIVGFIPTAYNTAAKTWNGTVNTADIVDFGASGTLLVTGLLMTNPIGLGVLAVVGVGYGIYRIGWGNDADKAINEKFGFR